MVLLLLKLLQNKRYTSLIMMEKIRRGKCKSNRNQFEDKMCLFGSNIHVLPSQFCFFLKCFFSLFFFGKIVRDRLQIFGARETGTRKRERKRKGALLLFDTPYSLPPPLLLSRYVKHPAQPNILCTCCPVPHPVFFPFLVGGKNSRPTFGPSLPLKNPKEDFVREEKGRGREVCCLFPQLK